jgi:tRNA A37 N6-isopentenylltransferase MiaA
MQVYKGLDHITSSPSSIEKSITPHLLYNYVEIEDKYDVVRYISDVKKKLLMILAI